MLLRLASQYAYYLMLSIDCFHSYRSYRKSDDDFERSRAKFFLVLLLFVHGCLVIRMGSLELFATILKILDMQD